MDLAADIRACVLEQLPHDGTEACRQALEAMPVGELVTRYVNWSLRFPAPRSRQVLKSKEFEANTARDKFAEPLGIILPAIETSQDLSRWLSRDVRFGYVANSTPKSQDKDRLLNDWGVHHLHLETKPHPKDPRFVARTNEVLFVMFKGEAAYVLDIFLHQQWTSRRVVEIAVGNWPEAGLFSELRGVIRVRPDVDESGHEKLRRNGVMAPVSVNGKFYVGGGYSRAGLSLRANNVAMAVMRAAKGFERAWKEDPDKARQEAEAGGGVLPPEPDWHFRFWHDGYGVVDEQTGARIVLSR